MTDKTFASFARTVHAASPLFLIIMFFSMTLLSGRSLAATEILSARNANDLEKFAEMASDEARSARACEFQRRNRVPPTFCYRNARDTAELDALCRDQSRLVTRIPKVDQFTSLKCREELEKRRRDLEYAAL